QVNHACEYAHIIMGAAVEAELGDRLSVTVIAARQSEAGAADAVTAPAVLREGDEARSKRTASETVEASAFDSQFIEKNPPARPPSRFVPPPTELAPAQKQQLLAQQKRSPYRNAASKMREETLPMETVARSRTE